MHYANANSAPDEFLAPAVKQDLAIYPPKSLMAKLFIVEDLPLAIVWLATRRWTKLLLMLAMTDLNLAADSIERGVRVVPLETGGVYALCSQPMAASHAGCAVLMAWFAQQVQR
ncbi:hypothetical protein ACMSI6_20440 [Pseudomonas antarctica]|uniref:hypothetical protein n=1 Tax=Pseudomonas antarctica TaxID=219572 RepID=UPI0039C16486